MIYVILKLSSKISPELLIKPLWKSMSLYRSIRPLGRQVAVHVELGVKVEL